MTASYWIIGTIEFREDGIAHIAVAKTKTAARKYAQRRLANAEFQWAEDGPDAERFRKAEADGTRQQYTLDQYAEWAQDRGIDAAPYRSYLLLRDGIWLTGPKGERVHVSEPSEVARRERRRAARSSRRRLLGVSVSELTKQPKSKR